MLWYVLCIQLQDCTGRIPQPHPVRQERTEKQGIVRKRTEVPGRWKDMCGGFGWGGRIKDGGERKNEENARRVTLSKKSSYKRLKEGLFGGSSSKSFQAHQNTHPIHLRKKGHLPTSSRSPFLSITTIPLGAKFSEVSDKTAHLIIKYFEPPQNMALRRPYSSPAQDNQAGLSKREQRKLEQTLKLFASPSDPKPKKKRKPLENEYSTLPIEGRGLEGRDCVGRSEEAQILVETKQQSQLNATPHYQPTVEPAKSPLLDQPTRKDQENPPHEPVLNPKYPFPEQQRDLLDFLMQYQCRQMEQAYLKEEQGFSGVDGQGAPLHVTSTVKSEELIKKINGMVGAFRKALDRKPLSKAHLALSASISEAVK